MIDNILYLDDLVKINNVHVPWDKLKGRSILVTGASGLIGSVLVDALIYRNEYFDWDMDLWLLVRNEEQLISRYGQYLNKKYFHYIIQDVAEPISISGTIDFIFHGASKGDPLSFALDPVGVMNANYMGMYRVLELAKEKQSQKVVYLSSGEVYGIIDKQTGDDWEGFRENEYAYLDILSLRSCYSSSKRAAETLCVSYAEQFGINVSIARPCHTYGPSMLDTDSRVIGYFLNKAVLKQDIVLKSQGLQRRSYCYVADTVSALIYILLKGSSGEAYNIASRNSTITLRQLADFAATLAGTKVIFGLPETKDEKLSSQINQAILDPGKLEKLGWRSSYNLLDGMERTVNILRSIKNS